MACHGAGGQLSAIIVGVLASIGAKLGLEDCLHLRETGLEVLGRGYGSTCKVPLDHVTLVHHTDVLQVQNQTGQAIRQPGGQGLQGVTPPLPCPSEELSTAAGGRGVEHHVLTQMRYHRLEERSVQAASCCHQEKEN